MQLFDLGGRVALVTGGNGGIGLGMARGLAKGGASIVVAGRDEEKNAAAVKELRELGGRCEAVAADLTGESGCRSIVDAAVQHFGRLDVLVNNAGTNIRKQPQEYSYEEWRLVLQTNLDSAFMCSQAAYEPMKKAGGGKIINIGSMMSIFGASFTAPYAASKGGIVQLTKALACAWAKDNIQVHAVLPGGAAHTGSALGGSRRFRGHRHLPGRACVRFCHRHGHSSRRWLLSAGCRLS
jgi:2-dehydro-3-deoxy-D-gluconate 5-dehydrogenase